METSMAKKLMSRAERLCSFFCMGGERPYMQAELAKAGELIKQTVYPSLLPHRKDALVSLLADVVGGHVQCPTGGIEGSELLRAINLGQNQIAAAEFLKFCY